VPEVRTNVPRGPTTAQVARIVLVVVAMAVTLLLIYALRQPLTWIFIAGFLAIALARPVAFFAERMARGYAIALVFVLLIGIPVTFGALLIPPIVDSVAEFADNVPQYATDVREYVAENERLRELDAEYDVTSQLQEQAGELPNRLGAAAGTLGDIGAGIVSSVFALVTILILTAFLLGGGAGWYRGFLALQPPDRRERLERVLERSAGAISGYVAGALVQATVAAVTSLIILSILGVPFAAALAVVMFFADLVPVVGATIGAVVVGLFTVFADFPTATIIWAIFSVVYQQFENSVIQPQIQRRTVNVNGFIVVVSVLFGTSLFGVLGALTAIPVAASIQIAIREWWAWRLEQRRSDPAAVSSTGAG
jgi:predicted PurR-regulated permease PerM